MSDYEEETTRFCDIPNCKRVSFIWLRNMYLIGLI